MTAQAASHVYFGLNPMWVSTCILAITYATIMSEKVNRAIVALVGASVMILVGVLDQDEAIKGIDWNTIGLLTGMMILVSISRRSGMFQYLAIWSAKAANAHPPAFCSFYKSPLPYCRPSSTTSPRCCWSFRSRWRSATR